MADQKITQLTADTSPTSDDLVVTVDSPGGTPANKKVTLSDLAGALGAGWTSYSPSWTGTGSNPAIGNGSIVGAYHKVGRTVHYRVVITAGSTTTFGTGSYRVSLPTTATETAVQLQTPMGLWGGYHSPDNCGAVSELVSSTTVGGLIPSLATGGKWGAELTNTNPVTWANGDTISFKGFYESTT